MATQSTKPTQSIIRSGAVRPLYAYIGVTDLAVAAVREYVADAQKTVSAVDVRPTALGQAYADLVRRGESLVGRIRRQQSTQEAVSSAETTLAKARTTRTQATRSTKATTEATTAEVKKAAKSTAKTAAATAKKRGTAPRSSAKATRTSARKTASSATKAVAGAAQKVGD